VKNVVMLILFFSNLNWRIYLIFGLIFVIISSFIGAIYFYFYFEKARSYNLKDYILEFFHVLDFFLDIVEQLL